jgi:predicted nucleotidyltransferase
MIDPLKRLSFDPDQLAAFCRERGIKRLAIFGSALREDFGPDSDLDQLVEFEPEQQVGLFRIARHEREQEALVLRPVDLRTLEDLGRHFRDEVARDARVIYERAA